jgi:S1/P1 Nuclease
MLFSIFMRATPLLLLFALTPPAFPWGGEGHELIARIADAQLTPAARAHVLEILGPGKTMESVASWADQIRRSRPATGPWHYIDIPIHERHMDLVRDCPKGDCVVAKIADMRAEVRNAAAPPEERREALMFLIHFVEDMHQPLHCSDNKDQGGNGVHVQFFDRTTNLHSVWDSGLLSRMGTEEQLFAQLSPDSARHARKFSKGTVDEWAEQSHKAAQKIVYGKLPKATPVVLNAAYEKTADRLVRRQIELAGARLAAVLNHDLE